MTYTEFQAWLDLHCPDPMDRDDFVHLLACIAAMQIERASNDSGHSVERLLASIFDGSTLLHS